MNKWILSEKERLFAHLITNQRSEKKNHDHPNRHTEMQLTKSKLHC